MRSFGVRQLAAALAPASLLAGICARVENSPEQARGERSGSKLPLQGDTLSAHHAVTAHGSNALELLAAARLLGDLPPSVSIIGIGPACIRTGIGLSPAVETAIPEALSRARTALESAIREAAKAPFYPG